jgi:hypothetical protein
MSQSQRESRNDKQPTIHCLTYEITLKFFVLSRACDTDTIFLRTRIIQSKGDKNMLQHKKSTAIIAFGVLFIFTLSTAPVIAHGPGHDDNDNHCEHCEKKITKMDSDGDGKVSRREFMKFHGDKFDKHDLNNDRFLDADEIHYMMEDMHKQMREHMHDDDHKHDNNHGNGHSHDNDNHSHEHNHDHD